MAIESIASMIILTVTLAVEGLAESADKFVHNPEFDNLALNVWLVWVLPMIGAMLSPLFGKAGSRVRDTAPAAFSLASAILASTLIPVALAGDEVHSQYTWIPEIGIRAGVLADTLSIIMSNLVAWISFLIMVYSIGYMKGDPNLVRYWFFMNFFIGSRGLTNLGEF